MNAISVGSFVFHQRKEQLSTSVRIVQKKALNFWIFQAIFRRFSFDFPSISSFHAKRQ